MPLILNTDRKFNWRPLYSAK